MNASATSTAASGSCHASSQPTPLTAVTAANTTATSPSTSGYRAEIGSAQLRQWPRNRNHENIGMLSRALIWCPQPGQCDAGETIDSPRGTRQITTLRKLPQQAPMSAAYIELTAVKESWSWTGRG